MPDTARTVKFISLWALWWRVGVFLTAFVDRFAPIRAFALDRFSRAHVPIPGHAKGAAASSTMSLVDGSSRTRLASQLANVNALFVIQLCSSRTLWGLVDGAKLDLGVEDCPTATKGLVVGDTLPILDNGVLRTTGDRLGYATGGCDIERGHLGAAWGLNVDTNTPLESSSILAIGTLDRGTASTSEVLAIGTHGRLQGYADVSLQQIPRATFC